jgi:hypothetical protein
MEVVGTPILRLPTSATVWPQYAGGRLNRSFYQIIAKCDSSVVREEARG